MRNFKLKFTHAVEIGAELAYIGHYQRTNELAVLSIAVEEKKHQATLQGLLGQLNDRTNIYLDAIFQIIGSVIGFLCLFSPKFILDKVAYLLEIFAIWSYNDLAKEYPQYKKIMLEMAKTEEEHRNYFR
jgi:rubrerythrin